jgi:prepilin-type processing-associated H-X9-DG protein
MPALAKTRDMAKRVICTSNMHQIGLTMKLHADDQGRFPDPNNWCDALAPYYGNNPTILVCPSAEPGRSNYALNPNAEPNSPPDMVLIFETGPGWNQSGGPELLSPDNHQGSGCNILFCDFHVEFRSPEQLDNLRWD